MNNNYISLLKNFEGTFIKNIPAHIRDDVIKRLTNPNHRGQGYSNNDVIAIVRRDIFSAIQHGSPLMNLKDRVIDHLTSYSNDPVNALSKPAVLSAIKILNHLFEKCDLYQLLLKTFTEKFIESLPEDIKPDVLARLQNPYHRGRGQSNNDVIEIVNKVFDLAINDNIDPRELYFSLTQALINYVNIPYNSASQPAVNSALKILNHLFTTNYFAKLPVDVINLIARFSFNLKPAVHHFGLVSQEFNKIATHLPYKYKEWEPVVKEGTKLKAASNGFKDFNCWYRNSYPTIKNLYVALKLYLSTGDLNQEFKAESAHGMGAFQQPNTIAATFRDALDPSIHGGLQQTIESAKHDLEIATTALQEGNQASHLIEISNSKHVPELVAFVDEAVKLIRTLNLQIEN